MTTLIRKPADPAQAGVLQGTVSKWDGKVERRKEPRDGVAERCACPEVGNDPEALLARWAYEDAIDAAAKQP
jgi:hypothetical protein